MNSYACQFIFYGDDQVDALENRIAAALEAEDLDFDPLTVKVEILSKERRCPMTLRQFIRENRVDLDAAIRGTLDDPYLKLNDEERRLWIVNDEGLYLWARSAGVRI